MNYYLLNCENKNPFFILQNINYIHIKAHISGLQVAICSSSKIQNDNCIEKTKNELQITLDDWIDRENENPEKDFEGNDILQTKINLNIYEVNNG